MKAATKTNRALAPRLLLSCLLLPCSLAFSSRGSFSRRGILFSLSVVASELTAFFFAGAVLGAGGREEQRARAFPCCLPLRAPAPPCRRQTGAATTVFFFFFHLYPQIWRRLELLGRNLEPSRFKASQ